MTRRTDRLNCLSLVARVILFTIFIHDLLVTETFAAQAITKSPPPVGQIDITLRTSRSQVTAGSGFGISADVSNKSDSSVYLVPNFFSMTPPPEIDPGSPGVWSAVIRGTETPSSKNFYDIPIRLGPGDKTTAFWARESEVGFQPRQVLERLRLVNFVPGEYTIKVVGLYWPDYKSAESKRDNYRSETAEIRVNVVAPQWVILLGSFVGGLIAYFLLPNIRLKPHKIEILGLLTAALMSSIITILLSRISETQFLVRITVNDVWGAIAIGFIASASGTSILQRYIKLPGSDAVGATREPDNKIDSEVRAQKP